MNPKQPPLLLLLLFLFSFLISAGGQQQTAAASYYYYGAVTITYTAFSPLSPTMIISSAPSFQENLARAIQQASNQTLDLLQQPSSNSSSSNGVSAQACGGASLSYADPVSGVCRLCTICVGMYQVGQCLYSDSVCVGQCPAGTYAHSGGAIGSGALGSCSPCLPGTFSSSAGVSACGICPNRTYASTHGATACTACAAGTITLTIGATLCVSAVRRRAPLPLADDDDMHMSDARNAIPCHGIPLFATVIFNASPRCIPV